MKDFRLAVFLGRFQPFHKSHLQVIEKALEQADKVLVILGSAGASPSIKNPFNVQERIDMIRNSLPTELVAKVRFDSIRDYFYSDNLWVSNVQSIVAKHGFDDCEVSLVSNYKDSSSYYLDLFPQWHKTIAWGESKQNATTVRQILFNRHCGLNDMAGYVPEGVSNWMRDNFIGTEKHAQMIREMEFIEDYKRSWETAPFPVTFVTTDTVVIKSGHVLMVKRKFEPGKGLLALPGGFIKQNERIIDGAIRELKEETRIEIPAPSLKTQITDTHVFDHPDRSTRGRTITHAYYIDLGKGELPKIKANDDAEQVMWVPLMDLFTKESEIYEDHLSIIHYFTNRQY